MGTFIANIGKQLLTPVVSAGGRLLTNAGAKVAANMGKTPAAKETATAVVKATTETATKTVPNLFTQGTNTVKGWGQQAFNTMRANIGHTADDIAKAGTQVAEEVVTKVSQKLLAPAKEVTTSTVKAAGRVSKKPPVEVINNATIIAKGAAPQRLLAPVGTSAKNTLKAKTAQKAAQQGDNFANVGRIVGEKIGTAQQKMANIPAGLAIHGQNAGYVVRTKLKPLTEGAKTSIDGAKNLAKSARNNASILAGKVAEGAKTGIDGAKNLAKSARNTTVAVVKNPLAQGLGGSAAWTELIQPTLFGRPSNAKQVAAK